jgi:hypothetical protein
MHVSKRKRDDNDHDQENMGPIATKTRRMATNQALQTSNSTATASGQFFQADIKLK